MPTLSKLINLFRMLTFGLFPPGNLFYSSNNRTDLIPRYLTYAYETEEAFRAHRSSSQRSAEHRRPRSFHVGINLSSHLKKRQLSLSLSLCLSLSLSLGKEREVDLRGKRSMPVANPNQDRGSSMYYANVGQERSMSIAFSVR